MGVKRAYHRLRKRAMLTWLRDGMGPKRPGLGQCAHINTLNEDYIHAADVENDTMVVMNEGRDIGFSIKRFEELYGIAPALIKRLGIIRKPLIIFVYIANNYT